ncbi:uncharacterized protein LOC120328916 isoform X2 [Styela clava]
MKKIQDQTCPICLENKEDLRMLPCWHVACMNCILSMAQRGEGRAVKCHICRQICLFENIRYLPKPLRCGCCNQFLKCSKIMPCCSKLYCVDCITRKSTENDAQLTCPGRCPRDFNSVDELPQSKLCSSCLHFHSDDTTLGDYSICARCDQKVREDISARWCPGRCPHDLNSIDELPQSKLCSLCFCLHSDDALLCGHTVCAECDQKLQKEKRGCPLCSAVKSPAPIPTDPIQPVQGQIEITMEGLENSNYRPLQQNRMGFFVPPHTLSLIQQLNRSHDHSMIQDRDELLKAFCIYTCAFVAVYFYGMSLMFWIILGASMLVTRPHLLTAAPICNLLEIGIMIFTFYSNFYQFIIFTIIKILLVGLLEIMYRIAFNEMAFYQKLLHSWVGAVIRLVIALSFFDELFVHSVLSTWLAWILQDKIEYNLQSIQI